MKLLLENWRKFINEAEKGPSPLDLEILPEQKILALKEPWNGFPSNIEQERGQKPNGVWYGCGDSWLKWIAREMPRWLTRVNYVYEIEVDHEFMYIIKDAERFKDFEGEFWARAPWQEKAPHTGPVDGYYEMIDWPIMATVGYDGIEICPYLSEFRMSTSKWYYPWDVASGCIWDSEALVGEPRLLWQRSPDEEGGEDETPA